MLLTVSIIIAIYCTHTAHGQMGPPPAWINRPTPRPTKRPTRKPHPPTNRPTPFDNAPFATESFSKTEGHCSSGPGPPCVAPCGTTCGRNSAPLTCHYKKAVNPGNSMECLCAKCVRKCGAIDLKNARYNVDECDIDPITQRENDIFPQVRDLYMNHAANVAGGIPKIGPFVSAAMHFGNGVFKMVVDDPNGLMNGIITDVNKMKDSMLKCMDQKILELKTDDMNNWMQQASWYYGLAANFDVDDDDDLENAVRVKQARLHNAWATFTAVIASEFDDEEIKAKYYKDLLMQVRGFVKAFELLSIDYLTYEHELTSEKNYRTAFDFTKHSIATLEAWVKRAKYVIVDGELRPKLYAMPCSNPDEMEALIVKWVNKFDEDYLDPIWQMEDDLDELNEILTGDLLSGLGSWYAGGKGATCDETCNAKGLICDADTQSAVTSESKIKVAFAAAGYVCKSFHVPRDYAGTPFSTGRDSDDCAPLIAGSKSVCNAVKYSHHYPLCYCKQRGVGWYKSAKGTTCDDTCQSKGLACDANKQSTITSESAIKYAFAEAGYDCKSFGDKPRNYAGTPFSTGRDNDDCYWLTSGAKSVCNAINSANQSPLCYCKQSDFSFGIL